MTDHAGCQGVITDDGTQESSSFESVGRLDIDAATDSTVDSPKENTKNLDRTDCKQTSDSVDAKTPGAPEMDRDGSISTAVRISAPQQGSKGRLSAFSVDVSRQCSIKTTARASFKEIYRQEQGSMLAGRYAAMGMHSLPGSSALLDVEAASLSPQPSDVTATMGINGAFFNLTNCCLGSTLVTLPYTCYQAGAVPFVCFMIVTAFMSLLSADMVVKAAMVTGHKSLELIGVQALGSRSRGIIGTAFIIILGLYVPLTVYIKLLEDTAPAANKLLDTSLEPSSLQLAIVILMVLPLCLIKDQAWLAFSSILALSVFLAVAVTTSVNLWRDDWYQTTAFEPAPCGGKAGLQMFGNDGILASIKTCSPILVAFVFHTSVLPIYQQMKEQKPENMQIVTRRSVVTAFLVYTFMGLCGAAAYSDDLADNIFLNFRHCTCSEWSDPSALVCQSQCKKWKTCADDQAWGNFLNAAFCVAIVIGFPNLHFTVRSVQISTFWPGEDAPFSWAIHTAYAIGNVCLSTLLAMFFAKDLGSVFNWAGVITSPLQAFLLPAGYFFLTSRRSTYDTISSSIVVGFGLLVMVMGSILLVMFSDE